LLGLALLVGCGGSSTPAPVAGPRGRLVSLNGRALRTVPVRVTGCAEQVTAADGSFDVSCATTAYDVAARPTTTTGVLYQGLTRRDPVVTVPFGAGPDEWVTVSGTVTGHVAGRQGGVAVTPPGGGSSGLVTMAADGSYSANASWFHDAEAAATVRALEWTEASNVGVTEFTAFGSARVAFAPGVDPIVSPTLQPILCGTLAITAPAPDPWNFVVHLWATWPDGGVNELGPPTWTAATAGNVRTPVIPGVTFTALVETAAGSLIQSVWRRELPASARVDPIVIPTAATFTSPASGAIIDLATEFAYDGVPEAVYLVAFESPSGSKRYVVTRATSLRMPDFAWAGLSTPDTGDLTVSVAALGPFASLDAAAGAPLVHLPRHWGRWGSNRVPSADGYATRQTMTVIVP
jgi:hypothetical protein